MCCNFYIPVAFVIIFILDSRFTSISHLHQLITNVISYFLLPFYVVYVLDTIILMYKSIPLWIVPYYNFYSLRISYEYFGDFA